MIARYIGIFVVLTGVVVSAAACSTSPTAPATVSSVGVTASAPGLGATSRFTETATMSDGTTMDVTSTATWGSSNTSDATVTGTGQVTGVAAGSVAIQATYQSVTGTDLITIGS